MVAGGVRTKVLRREILAFRRPYARRRNTTGLHKNMDHLGIGTQVRESVWCRTSAAWHKVAGRQLRRVNVSGKTHCATALSGLHGFSRRSGRMMVRRCRSQVCLLPAVASLETSPYTSDPLKAESVGFQSISPSNRFQFDPDRIHDRNHGSSLEYKSRKG